MFHYPWPWEGLQQRAAPGCCRPGCAMCVAMHGGLTGQGNPIPGKKAQGWCLPGGRGSSVTDRQRGMFSSAPDPGPNPTHRMKTPGHLWGQRVTQTQSKPRPLHLLGVALFYFITTLFIHTIHDIYRYKFMYLCNLSFLYMHICM